MAKDNEIEEPVVEPTITEQPVKELTVTEPTVVEPIVTELTVVEPTVTEPTIEESTVIQPIEENPFQNEADELMEQLNLSEIWRLTDGRWYTNEVKAKERNTSSDEIDHFKKAN